MTKAQYWVIFAAIALFAGLYFGFDTKPINHKKKESVETESAKGESTSFESLLTAAKSQLTSEQSTEIVTLEKQVEAAATTPEKIELMKKLSGLWYDFQQVPVAGGWAEQVAALENVDSSWSITGATFFNGLVMATAPEVRSFCAEHARLAFENAAKLNPANVEHQVNIALVYAENPPPDNPMRAVLMLREMETKYPNEPAVFNALGRLAIKTKQWGKAIERLEKARQLDPKNPNTPCLLAKAYEGAGQMEQAQKYAQECNQQAQ